MAKGKVQNIVKPLSAARVPSEKDMVEELVSPRMGFMFLGHPGSGNSCSVYTTENTHNLPELGENQELPF